MSVTPVPGDPHPTFDLYGHQTHTYTRTQSIHTHKRKINIFCIYLDSFLPYILRQGLSFPTWSSLICLDLA